MSHTPGPWYSGPVYLGEWELDGATVGNFPTGPGTDRPKGECHHEGTICEVWGSNHDCAANAALIAAAPELLAACEEVRRCGNGGAKLSRRASGMVRAAIKKATTPEPRRWSEEIAQVKEEKR